MGTKQPLTCQLTHCSLDKPALRTKQNELRHRVVRFNVRVTLCGHAKAQFECRLLLFKNLVLTMLRGAETESETLNARDPQEFTYVTSTLGAAKVPPAAQRF